MQVDEHAIKEKEALKVLANELEKRISELEMGGVRAGVEMHANDKRIAQLEQALKQANDFIESGLRGFKH